MKSLVDGECGRSNALVGLARDYGTSNQRIAPATSRGATSLLPSSSLGEQFANDFLQQKAQGTAAPSSFNMNALSAQLPRQSSSSSLANTWGNEFAAKSGNQLASQWSSQYASSRPSMESAWKTAVTPQSSQLGGQSSSVDSGMWSAEFLDNVDTSLQRMQVPQDPASQMADAWADEFSDQHEGMWGNMESEWNAIQRNVEQAQGDFISKADEDNYVHQDENPFMTASDPIASGDQLMNAGDLGNAMLAYEAAVQKNPQDAKAWCRLGLSHAENEHDAKAIAAFNNCLKIEPNNQEALLALSVSLANECLENNALQQLDKWLTAHQGFDVANSTVEQPHYSSLLDNATFAKVEERFLSAARQQNGTADSALQNALGVLYNLNRNFDRAVDCIKLAISSSPEDPRLWNRLGATLANGDRTIDAIAAYREALTRYPTYVRARYNLGISCMHLNSYREAIDHFLSALDLQKGGSEGHSIWPTLRSASIRARGCSQQLIEALDQRDITAYKNALKSMPNTN